ncbi:Heavy metal-associated domain HMA [Arabidopsis thaliana x Arabidopsis arenosa]|uniref:Heavy metal-associated domain HMA n=1 Tax=Arabidopsis thaliana x Arabidopsis arenosa TaxID=1240361 RepID=A0A8T1YBX7_9BRAS|nr:Heavy metal-associated domain HMA [Arabidopsis thaliana x Arabidopsis arenosa]
MVTGNFNLEKLLKTLKKKTGKKAEILMMNEKADMKENDEEKIFTEKKEEGDIVQENDKNPEVEEKIDTSETSTTKVEIHIVFLCEKYEEDIGKVISKFEGVKTCVVDVENQKIVITGDFDEEKLLEKLKKKMRKRIIKVEKNRNDEEAKIVIENDEEIEMDRGVYMYPNSDDEKEMAKYMMFSDENPNACSIS